MTTDFFGILRHILDDFQGYQDDNEYSNEESG